MIAAWLAAAKAKLILYGALAGVVLIALWRLYTGIQRQGELKAENRMLTKTAETKRRQANVKKADPGNLDDLLDRL